MKFVDTHCHINLSYYQDDVDEVVRRAQSNGTSMIVVGTDYKSSKRALDIANRYQSGVYAAVGLHPESLEDRIETTEEGGDKAFLQGEKFSGDIYRQLAKFPRVVGVGEAAQQHHAGTDGVDAG